MPPMRDSRDETEDAGRQSVRTSARVRTDSMAFSPSPENASAVRPYRPEDEPGVRELIDADRLPGQPHCTPEKLAAARRAPASLVGWAGPARPQISVLADVEGRAHGVIAYLSWTDVKSGVICWVHAHENPPALRALLGHALAALAHCPQIEAFVGAPPGPLGPGGLPRTRRGATHDALLRTGFTGRRQGCYLHVVLPVEPPPAKLVADVFPCDFPQGHRLIIREAAEPVAEAVISVGPDRTATVYWIETLLTHRRCGLGRKLLSQALALLAEQGANEVALVVDDASQPTTDCQAAPQLFDSFGFTVVDQLWTYRHLPPGAHAACRVGPGR
ncbi:GNAT family N-acetyltransferase [Streptomyces sp. RLB3-17]|nr:GNAT family N-acetyltransferase [Streptomyces sp. S1D4-20]QDN65645.1 GNAT family N-acetyltransferase [Streptomyces sp. S1D4-14]QDN96289.1 GNAT family N-acetyltransferase [Streptomyces sp. RLB1-9]QDO17998.1 GNAT family N-acetyltransferase [Streptomyces sp. S1A1-8]QDO28125.1 GNAT family N-acetyltransferase [Streptomyces sp. S1A1-3]QDO38013.1 GNAT family N-acetyltransferase [Streptomyces sp. RLB3-17]QDO48050.1 GNAT family N-acetyltransferase [Streptomyces sp. RLB3-5]QDO58291.1 GNAT family N-